MTQTIPGRREPPAKRNDVRLAVVAKLPVPQNIPVSALGLDKSAPRQRQRRMMQRFGSYSDVIRGMQGVSNIKGFLYAWGVLVIMMGLALLCMGLFLLYYQHSAHIMPALTYYLASYTGLALSLVSLLGLYGLQQQRKCVSEGRRNYALALFIALSVVGALILLLGGIVALTLRGVVKDTQRQAFGLQTVQYFETAVVSSLHKYATESPADWRSLQNTWSCCGYEAPDAFEAAALWDESLLGQVKDLNSVAGGFCTSNAVDCTGQSTTPCPVKSHDWCRADFLSLMLSNYELLGVSALVLSASHFLSSAFASFTLLCDVRMQLTTMSASQTA